MHWKVYIKSHPLGIENNSPRLDVEVYATGTDREKLEGDVLKRRGEIMLLREDQETSLLLYRRTFTFIEF